MTATRRDSGLNHCDRGSSSSPRRLCAQAQPALLCLKSRRMGDTTRSCWNFTLQWNTEYQTSCILACLVKQSGAAEIKKMDSLALLFVQLLEKKNPWKENSHIKRNMQCEDWRTPWCSRTPAASALWFIQVDSFYVLSFVLMTAITCILENL